VSKATGIITTIVGVCNTVAGGVNAGVPGPVSGASFSTTLQAVEVAPNGDIYLSQAVQNRVMRVEAATGQISEVVGGSAVGWAMRLKWYNGKLYIMDHGLSAVTVYDPASGQASTAASKANWGGWGSSRGIAFDGSGNMFVLVSERELHVGAPPYTSFSRWTAPGGYPTGQDDVDASSANFKKAYAVAVNAAGTYAYVVDIDAYCIRKIGLKWF
jgi:hypothetical protein